MTDAEGRRRKVRRICWRLNLGDILPKLKAIQATSPPKSPFRQSGNLPPSQGRHRARRARAGGGGVPGKNLYSAARYILYRASKQESKGETQMKRIAIMACSSLMVMTSGAVSAGQWVDGYMKSDGTYVQGYSRSSPDSYRYNNRGSQTLGGTQRDEYSSGLGATNRSNPSWGWRDNDNDGWSNSYDRRPESGRNW